MILGLILSFTPEGTGLYNVLFALVTGAVASFFVTFIVELSGNYRHNKLGWYELEDYYHVVSEFEVHKNIRMGRSSYQRAEKLAKADAGVLDDPDYEDIRSEIDKEYEKDVIHATWVELPEFAPILMDTLENKKEFLSDREIEVLGRIKSDYEEIRTSVKEILTHPYLFNALNHPEEDVLKSVFPQNIINDMPAWTQKHIASEMSLKTMDDLTDKVLADSFLRDEYLKDYDISQHGLDSYNSDTDEEESIEFEEMTDAEMQAAIDEQAEYEASLTEDEFRAEKEEQDRILLEEERPFVSWFISGRCKSISDEMNDLEKVVLKKPFYSIHLSMEKEWDRKTDRELMRDEGFKISYDIEMEHIKRNRNNNE